MRTRVCVSFLLFFLLCIHAMAEEPGLNSFRISPGASIPLGEDAEYFTIGGGADFSGEFRMPFFPALYLGIGAGYNFIPINANTSLSLISAGGTLGIEPRIGGVFGIKAYGRGGYFYAMLNDFSSTGMNPWVAGGGGISLYLGDSFGISLTGEYRMYFYLYTGIGASLTLSFANRPRQQVIEQPVPAQPQPLVSEEPAAEGKLEIAEVNVIKIFPVFYKYYDDNPIGTVLVRNDEEVPMEKVKAKFYVKQYMDNPKESPAIERLEPGGEREIDLYGLFTDQVMEVSEGTKVSAQVLVDFEIDGEEYTKEWIGTIEMYDRNAITWTDDRKAAAFVTGKDTNVLRFSKNIAGMTKGIAGTAVNENLLKGIGIHTALSLYGMTYVIDPQTPYEDLSKNAMAVDFLQFPNQTLEYRAGDCDDLSILNNALLESLGVETAFITVPGHIYAAFSLNMDPDEARRLFSRPDELIFRDGKSWVPVEITEIDGGFLNAWQTGAKQWREHSARGQAGFYPVHEAWEIYQPVGFISEKVDMAIPPAEAVAAAYEAEVTKFVDREIFEPVAALQAQIAGANNPTKAINRLAVLYARYGLYDRAKNELSKVLETSEHLPALLNMGNIYFLQGEMQNAIEYFNRAAAIKPDNPNVLLCIARTNHEIENYANVRDAYGKLKMLDPELAARFAYLDLRGNEASRAAEIGQVKGTVVWVEEE